MILASLIKELKLLARDVHGLAVLFVMPIAFMLIMSLALSRDAEPQQGSRVALVGDAAHNEAFAAALQKEHIHVTLMPSEHLLTAQKQLGNAAYDMVLHNSNDTETSLKDEQMVQIFVPPDTERAWLAAMKGVLQKHYTETRLNAYFDSMGDIPIRGKNMPETMRRDMQKEVNRESGKRFDAVRDYLQHTRFAEQYLTSSGQAVAKPNAVQHSVPAWLIFGMFFIMIPLSNVMAMERQTNTLTRLRLARAPAWILLLAKFVPYFLINQLQFVGMLLLGKYLLPQLGVSALAINGALGHYVLLACAVSFAALGYALLISVWAKTTEHAVVLGGGGIILMAALGGIMVPAHVMPPMMQQLTWISPMAWGLKAFEALLLNRAGLAGIGLYLQLLSAFAAICLLLALLRYGRQLKTQARF